MAKFPQNREILDAWYDWQEASIRAFANSPLFKLLSEETVERLNEGSLCIQDLLQEISPHVDKAAEQVMFTPQG